MPPRKTIESSCCTHFFWFSVLGHNFSSSSFNFGEQWHQIWGQQATCTKLCRNKKWSRYIMSCERHSFSRSFERAPRFARPKIGLVTTAWSREWWLVWNSHSGARHASSIDRSFGSKSRYSITTWWENCTHGFCMMKRNVNSMMVSGCCANCLKMCLSSSEVRMVRSYLGAWRAQIKMGGLYPIQTNKAVGSSTEDAQDQFCESEG